MTVPATVAELNELDREAFANQVGFVYESSPWVALAAWDQRPFTDLAALTAALEAAVEAAPRERQVELIRSHPPLASGVLSALTESSASEQTNAGLDRLPTDLHQRLASAQDAYRERFGFPFVVCVREHTAESIVAAAELRVKGDPERERNVALGEIAKIARYRLVDAFTDTDTDRREGTS